MPHDTRTEKSDRRLLEEIAEATLEIRQSWPKYTQLVLEHEASIRAHSKRLDDHGARLNALEDSERSIPVQTMREPLPSLSDFDEEKTLNGTPTGNITGSPEKIRALIQAQVSAQLEEHDRTEKQKAASAAVLARAESDARPWRFIVAEVWPKTWKTVLVVVIGGFISNVDRLVNLLKDLFRSHP